MCGHMFHGPSHMLACLNAWLPLGYGTANMTVHSRQLCMIITSTPLTLLQTPLGIF